MGYAAGELDDTPQHDETPLADESPMTEDTQLPFETTQANDNSQPEDIGAQTHGVTPAKSSQGRSKNFSVEEDLLLVSG